MVKQQKTLNCSRGSHTFKQHSILLHSICLITVFYRSKAQSFADYVKRQAHVCFIVAIPHNKDTLLFKIPVMALFYPQHEKPKHKKPTT